MRLPSAERDLAIDEAEPSRRCEGVADGSRCQRCPTSIAAGNVGSRSIEELHLDDEGRRHGFQRLRADVGKAARRKFSTPTHNGMGIEEMTVAATGPAIISAV